MNIIRVDLGVSLITVIIIIIIIIGFLGQFRKMSNQFNHQPILFNMKLNATKKGSFDFF